MVLHMEDPLGIFSTSWWIAFSRERKTNQLLLRRYFHQCLNLSCYTNSNPHYCPHSFFWMVLFVCLEGKCKQGSLLLAASFSLSFRDLCKSSNQNSRPNTCNFMQKTANISSIICSFLGLKSKKGIWHFSWITSDIKFNWMIWIRCRLGLIVIFIWIICFLLQDNLFLFRHWILVSWFIPWLCDLATL